MIEDHDGEGFAFHGEDLCGPRQVPHLVGVDVVAGEDVGRRFCVHQLARAKLRARVLGIAIHVGLAAHGFDGTVHFDAEVEGLRGRGEAELAFLGQKRRGGVALPVDVGGEGVFARRDLCHDLVATLHVPAVIGFAVVANLAEAEEDPAMVREVETRTFREPRGAIGTKHVHVRLVGLVMLLRRAEVIRHHELGDDFVAIRDRDVIFFGDGDVEGLRVKREGEEEEGVFHERIFLMTFAPSTPVSFASRPWNLKLKASCWMPS